MWTLAQERLYTVLYCVPDCPSCLACLNGIGMTTWAVWELTKYSLGCTNKLFRRIGDMWMFIVWYPPEFSRLQKYTPAAVIGTLSYSVSSHLRRIQHLRTLIHAAIANHYNLAFSFHQVPITAGWTKAAWFERLAQHLYTWPTRTLEHQSPNRAQRYSTSVIWLPLATTLPCAWCR